MWPMSTENAADAALTRKPMTTLRGWAGMVAHTVKAKTMNSGPGGCQWNASESSEAPAATRAPTSTIHHWRCGSNPTAQPSVTAATRTPATEICNEVRSAYRAERP